MIDTHSFLGSIDLDSPDHMIAPGFHRTARNLIFKGVRNRLRAESVLGTTAIINPNLPATGVNLCIGCFYDPVNQQLYDFNFNSLGTSGIYLYSTQTGIWQTIIQVGTNTVGDPLGFLGFPRIQGVTIIYGDATDGNLLFFLNSSGVPTKINVQRYLNTPYVNINRPLLNVIKAPPRVPPRVTYENDNTVNSNNLLNSLFQFAYSYIYDDFEESVISSGSIVPLPVHPFSATQNMSVSLDSRISIYLRTGPQNVTKLRIYMRQTQNGVTSNWFIVDTIQKSTTGISDDTIYRYLFYNSGNYVPADPQFTSLLFDFVPQQAGCQELLNGDTISYAAITEGYNWFKSMFSTTMGGNFNPGAGFNLNGILFFADYNGLFTGSQPQVTVYLTGAGTNDGSGNPTTLPGPPEFFNVNADSNGTDVSFAYINNISFFTSIPSLLSALQSAATSAGWTFVSSTTNSFTVYYPTGTVNLHSSYTKDQTGFITANGYNLAFYPKSNYSFGVVYYDANGITNGVITDVSANASTLPYTVLARPTYSEVNLNLNAIIPPSWAVYYHVVRTNTLTYNKFLDWVSGQTFSNVGQLVAVQYAYIGISNIADYNISIQGTQGVVGYEFTAGDRITFLGKYAFDGSFIVLNNDYEILGVATDPVINGTTQTGSYIQIAYPTADINAGFKFDGTPDFQNYLIQVYNITSNVSPQTANTGTSAGLGNVFYETGLEFGIGNPGLNTAFHYGNNGNNQVQIYDGDAFFRQRTVPAGTTYYILVEASNFSNRYVTPPIPGTTVTNSQFTINAQSGAPADPSNPAAYPRFADGGGLFLNTSGQTLQIRLRGTIQTSANHPTWMDIVAKIDDSSGANATELFLLKKSDPIGTVTDTSLDIELDATFGVPAGSKMWLLFGNGESVVNLQQYAFQLRLDIVKQIPIMVFDKSFSDTYNLITNSDSRAVVQDTTAKNTYFSTLFRYSLNYQVGTNINNTNRFYPNNFDEFDKSHGDVVRMKSRQRELRVFQKRRTGRVGIYAKFVKNNDGNTNLIVSDTIITQNNIQYYEGEFGIGNQPDSLSSSGFADYFVDPVKAEFLRLSVNGLENITHELTQGSKVQSFAGNALPPYLNQFDYPFGGNSVILGAYNFTQDRDSEAIFVFQAGTHNSTNLQGQSLAFVEAGNRWSSFYDFAPDAIVCCENNLFSFSNGVLYIHNNNTTYCNFYGQQFVPSIAVVKNDQPLVGKTFIGISQVSNVIWNSPLLYTDMNTYPGQRQESATFDQYFQLLEAQYRSPFFKDIHSIGGIGNGNSLKGQLMVILLQPTDGSKFSWLAQVAIKYIVSPVLQR